MTTSVLYNPTKYSIVPDIKLFKSLGATGEPAYRAISELIDNAIDATLPGNTTRVHIAFRKNSKNAITSINITDNGVGMNKEDLAKAFVIGLSSKTTASKIGRFGLGLKTAITSLGTSWSIRTVPQNSDIGYIMIGSLDQLKDWSVVISEFSAVGQDTGTTISIVGTDRLNAANFESDIYNQLPELFRYFITNRNLILTINDITKPVSISPISLIEDSFVDFNTEINGKVVRGWVGLKTNGSLDYGLSFVRNNRILEKSVKIGFTPHPSLNRVIGDVHIDEFETNHHKTAFNKSNNDWFALEDYIKDLLKPIVDKARNLSALDSKKINTRIETAVLVSILDLQDILNENIEFTFKTATPTPTPKPIYEDNGGNGESKVIAEKENIRNRADRERGGGIKIHHLFVNQGIESKRKAYELEGNTLTVVTNTAHPAFPDTGGQHSWAMQNIIESVAAYKTEQENDKSAVGYENNLDNIYRIIAEEGMSY